MLKIKFILLIFFPVVLILSASDLYSQNTQSKHYYTFYKNISDSTNVTSDKYNLDIPEYKSPYLAGVMSFIIPGLPFGQLYNRQPVKALIHVGFTVCSFIAAALAPGGGHPDYGGAIIGGSILAVNWIWSTTDAVISAIVNNKEIERKKNLELINSGNFPDTSKILYLIKNDNYVRRKEPFLSGLFSFITPGLGLGQLYNKQPVKTLIHLGITAAASTIAATVKTKKDRYYGLYIGGGIFLINWLWSIGDAIVTSYEINNEIDYRIRMRMKNSGK